MYDERELIEKLKKIEALFAGTPELGEKHAASQAAERIKERLESFEKSDPPVEYSFSMTSMWSKRLFMALLRRYGIKPYRYHRQRHTTVMALVPKSFVDTVLWPEFKKIDRILTSYVDDITNRVISENIYPDNSDAEIREK